MTGRYTIKCDDCKTTIGRTDSVPVSAAGGRCDECRAAASDPYHGIFSGQFDLVDGDEVARS